MRRVLEMRSLRGYLNAKSLWVESRLVHLSSSSSFAYAALVL